MPNEEGDRWAELDRFAEALIEGVRDPAIAQCDVLADGRIRGPRGDRWRELTNATDVRQALHELIPEIVDETLFRLLDMIDNDSLPIAWRTSDGTFAPLYDLGMSETAGWYVGSPGWRHAHARQRFTDDLPAMNIPDDPW